MPRPGPEVQTDRCANKTYSTKSPGYLFITVASRRLELERELLCCHNIELVNRCRSTVRQLQCKGLVVAIIHSLVKQREVNSYAMIRNMAYVLCSHICVHIGKISINVDL